MHRTPALVITNHPLCQLSYGSISASSVPALGSPRAGESWRLRLRGAAFSSKCKTPYPFTGRALTFSISVSRKPLPFSVSW